MCNSTVICSQENIVWIEKCARAFGPRIQNEIFNWLGIPRVFGNGVSYTYDLYLSTVVLSGAVIWRSALKRCILLKRHVHPWGRKCIDLDNNSILIEYHACIYNGYEISGRLTFRSGEHLMEIQTCIIRYAAVDGTSGTLLHKPGGHSVFPGVNGSLKY